MRPSICSMPILISTLLLISSPSARADEPTTRGARVHNLKVLSDQIDDVTTVENILKSFVKPGMKDDERARAIWTAVVKYRHQTIPPQEYLSTEWEVHDPVKLFNVYGYCQCCCCAALIAALNRADGRETRGRILTAHSVPEVKYGDGWHMFDASLITLFPKPGSGALASVDEISDAVGGWYAKNPGYKGNASKLVQLMRGDNWTGWKSKGPELLANCPYYKLGYFPAGTHGWDATMAEYDRKCQVYEYGYHMGHRALFSLRPGEALVREAANRGLHVNMDRTAGWGGLNARAPLNDLVYLKDFAPRYTGGLVANGYHRYVPDLATGGLAAGADVYDNLASGGSPALHLKQGGKPGTAIIAMASPYVYLGGRLKLRAVRGSDADHVAVSISTNNGRTFTPLWAAEKTGNAPNTVDLGERILRRYAYWLKIEIQSTSETGAGLEVLEIENDIQHAPRTLPWINQGTNTITVAADGDSTLATQTIACRITADAKFTKNETTQSMGVAFENLKVQDGSCWWQGGVGSMTVPIEVPGDLAALNFGGHIRARGARDVVKMLLSFDEGKSWKEAARIAGPTPATTNYFRFAAVPVGVRKALLRYELSGNNTIGIFSFRVDADYRDPRAAAGIRPIQVVYRWKENGELKTQQTTIQTLPQRWQIDTKGNPALLSVTCEMPAK